MVVLCEKLITGEISKADVMSTDEHYCNYGKGFVGIKSVRGRAF